MSSSVLDSNTPPPPPVKDIAQTPAAAPAKVPRKKGPLKKGPLITHPSMQKPPPRVSKEVPTPGQALEATVLEPAQEGPVAMLEHSVTPEETEAAQPNSPDLTTNLLEVQRGAQSYFTDSQEADSDEISIDGHTVIQISRMRRPRVSVKRATKMDSMVCSTHFYN